MKTRETVRPIFKQNTPMDGENGLLDKMYEEATEVHDAWKEFKATGNNAADIVKEAYDLKQIADAILEYCQNELKVNLKYEASEHLSKLVNRQTFVIKGFIYETYIGE